MEKLAPPDLPGWPGIAPSLRAVAVGPIIARMACPGLERTTRRRLAECSALGKLPGTDFETMGPMRPCHASDAPVVPRGVIERHLFDRAMGLFGLQRTVTPYGPDQTLFSRAGRLLQPEGPARTLQGQVHRRPAARTGAGA